MKRCSKCEQHKDEGEFGKNKSKKDGLQGWCKACVRDYAAKRYAENPEKQLASNAKWRAENPEKKRAYNAKWRATNPGKQRASEAKWRAANPEKHRAAMAKWRAKNPEKQLAINAKWRAKNPGYSAKYEQERKRTDRQYALACSLRDRLNKALKGNFKSGSAVRDLGMTIPEFEAYIEPMFLPGMTWDNWTDDGWHLDHIYPLAKADLTDRVQFLAVANWRNYQPLWAKDNLSKGDSITPEAQALFDRLVAQFRKEEAA